MHKENLSSLHAQPEGEAPIGYVTAHSLGQLAVPMTSNMDMRVYRKDHFPNKSDWPENLVPLYTHPATAPQGTGSREAVAYRVRHDRPFGGVWKLQHVLHERDNFDIVEPLVHLAQLQAVERERDQWQKLATEDVEALQAIGEEFGIHGVENRVAGVRRILTEQRASLAAAREDFQARVSAAHNALFHDDPTDLAERRDRFGEEANEVQQALGQTRDAAHQLVDYTYDRAIGDPEKEIGAAALTLASLCVVGGYSMMQCAEADLEKLQQPETIARIRAKRSTRHGRGPLPGISP